MSSNADLRLAWCSHQAALFACLAWHYSRSLPAGKLVKVGVWEVPANNHTSVAAICACGATERHATAPDRCGRGHVLVGNATARKHGVDAFEARGPVALPTDLRVTVDEFRNQVIRDRGGMDSLTAIEAGYIRRLAELETVARLLATDLAGRGLMTAKGRVRSTFSRWLEALDRWDRYAQGVGMESRRSTLTLAQRLAAAPLTSETEDRDAGE